MYAEHFFVLVALILVVSLGVQAWKNGVVGMLWGIIGVAGGILGGAAIYHLFIGGLALSFGVKLALAALAGLVIYLIVRALAKAMLMGLFQPDSPLSFFADGFGGMLVSLIPSLLTVAVLAAGMRIGGTLSDLRRFELFATQGREFLAKDHPPRPLAAQWRDGLESLPRVRDGIDVVEPFGRPAERNLVGLLTLSKKPALAKYLAEEPATRPVIESPPFQSLLANEAIRALNAKGDRLALLRHPDLRAAALDPAIRPTLTEMELARLIDGYLLSPEWQTIVESYQRDPEDTRKAPEE